MSRGWFANGLDSCAGLSYIVAIESRFFANLEVRCADAGAGGGSIVLRQAATPLVGWCACASATNGFCQGKLDSGETPRDAAEREVNEETGHDVSVHEFLGTLVYEARGGSKVVHYWRMERGPSRCAN